MKYLIDTSICIHFFRGTFNLYENFQAVGIEDCAISEITLAELVFGAESSSIQGCNRVAGIKIDNWIKR